MPRDPSASARDDRDELWPSLEFVDWADTCATLQMWTQIVGKIRLVLSPWINHFMGGRALSHGARADYESDSVWRTHVRDSFRFYRARTAPVDQLWRRARVEVATKTVADFYREIIDALRTLGIEVQINTTPNEVADAIPFEHDTKHAAYDPEYANRFWPVLLQADRLFKQFRGRFCGKCSPVHFFWGSFDLAVTRFSGRAAPPHPGGVPHLPDAITREAYSQEVSSLGFWPGNEQMPQPLFYSYAYPQPDGFVEAGIQPRRPRSIRS